jgi:ubiquinone/menaquinone biosynthesis C-methylase UbiE
MPMNRIHRKLCSSEKWADSVASNMPGRLAGYDLGDDVLEIGPGFGATTAVLLDLVPKLTALEIDEASTALLTEKYGDRATIVRGDGAAMPFEDNTFSAVVCFTMMHHVPSARLQDAILAEALRVLRPGGILRGTDSQASLAFRFLHIGDTMNVLNPSTLPKRLSSAGFRDVHVDHIPKKLVSFSALKPAQP